MRAGRRNRDEARSERADRDAGEPRHPAQRALLRDDPELPCGVGELAREQQPGAEERRRRERQRAGEVDEHVCARDDRKAPAEQPDEAQEGEQDEQEARERCGPGERRKAAGRAGGVAAERDEDDQRARPGDQAPAALRRNDLTSSSARPSGSSSLHSTTGTPSRS